MERKGAMRQRRAENDRRRAAQVQRFVRRSEDGAGRTRQVTSREIIDRINDVRRLGSARPLAED